MRDPYVGRVIDGRFTLQKRLGKGGMGMVYRAEQAPLGRQVAIKLMLDRGEPDREDEFQRRFFLEASTAAKLKHPNTITVFDYGSDVIDDERMYFIVMEYLEGRTLTKAIKKEGPFSPARAAHVAVQMARSLREAHRQDVVHRDLKPGNVMLLKHDSDEGNVDFVKVLDFGLAKSFAGAGPALTQAGTFLGSPRYVSPEQIEGKQVDPRADIYSFGCVLYRMLTGRVPFTAKTPVDIMMQHLESAPPALDVAVPAVLEDLVFDCLEKDRKHRPQTMDDVIDRLKQLKNELGESSFARLSSLEMSGGHSVAPTKGPSLDDDDRPTEYEPKSARALAEAAARRESSRNSASEDDDDSESWSPDEDLSLDLTRPTHVLQGRVRGVKRGVAAMLVVGAAGVLAFAHHQGALVPFLEDRGWPVPAFLAPAPTVVKAPDVPVADRRPVVVMARSTPPANVTLLAPGATLEGEVDRTDAEDWGISPVDQELQLAPGEQRVLLFERKGHRRARALIEGPAADVAAATDGKVRLTVEPFLPVLPKGTP